MMMAPAFLRTSASSFCASGAAPSAGAGPAGAWGSRRHETRVRGRACARARVGAWARASAREARHGGKGGGAEPRAQGAPPPRGARRRAAGTPPCPMCGGRPAGARARCLSPGCRCNARTHRARGPRRGARTHPVGAAARAVPPRSRPPPRAPARPPWPCAQTWWRKVPRTLRSWFAFVVPGSRHEPFYKLEWLRRDRSADEPRRWSRGKGHAACGVDARTCRRTMGATAGRRSLAMRRREAEGARAARQPQKPPRRCRRTFSPAAPQRGRHSCPGAPRS